MAKNTSVEISKFEFLIDLSGKQKRRGKRNSLSNKSGKVLN